MKFGKLKAFREGTPEWEDEARLINSMRIKATPAPDTTTTSSGQRERAGHTKAGLHLLLLVRKAEQLIKSTTPMR